MTGVVLHHQSLGGSHGKIYHMVGLDSYNVVPPVDSVQLVAHNSNVTMVFGTYNCSFHGG